MRLLLLGRSGRGYANQNQAPSLEQAVPLLRDEKDPLVASVQVLIAVSQQRDRAKKVTLLTNGLQTAQGASAIPLLAALQRRALLAAQMPDTTAAVTKHLSDPLSPVRETTARGLYTLLDADYLDQPRLREAAVAALAATLKQKNTDLTVRVAALDALAAAGAPALKNGTAAGL